MNFFSVDVETANSFRGSICQIGWTTVVDGKVQDTETILIDPQQPFDPFNISIHGINQEAVTGAPPFSDVKEKLRSVFKQAPVTSYGAFDMAAFALADDGRSETPFLEDHLWVNAQKIVRRAWPEHFSKKYSLRLVADTLDLELKHHDAGSDAEVAARAVLLAAAKLDMSFEQLAKRTQRPLSPSSGSPIQFAAGEEGPLAGEVITFTGALSLARREAAKIANDLGAGVADNTTKKTSILVVGVQDSYKIVGEKSSKHRKAEALIANGQLIEILTEQDFLRIVGQQ